MESNGGQSAAVADVAEVVGTGGEGKAVWSSLTTGEGS